MRYTVFTILEVAGLKVAVVCIAAQVAIAAFVAADTVADIADDGIAVGMELVGSTLDADACSYIAAAAENTFAD